jgi:hypothetical protein
LNGYLQLPTPKPNRTRAAGGRLNCFRDLDEFYNVPYARDTSMGDLRAFHRSDLNCCFEHLDCVHIGLLGQEMREVTTFNFTDFTPRLGTVFWSGTCAGGRCARYITQLIFFLGGSLRFQSSSGGVESRHAIPRCRTFTENPGPLP